MRSPSFRAGLISACAAGLLAACASSQEEAGAAGSPSEVAPLIGSLAEDPHTVTPGEAASVHDQVQRCWNPPASAPNDASLIVELRIHLDPDGSVQRIEKIDNDKFEHDPFHKLAAQEAIRTVQRCGPLELPPEKYAAWRVMVLRFDPRDLLEE